MPSATSPTWTRRGVDRLLVPRFEALMIGDDLDLAETNPACKFLQGGYNGVCLLFSGRPSSLSIRQLARPKGHWPGLAFKNLLHHTPNGVL